MSPTSRSWAKPVTARRGWRWRTLESGRRSHGYPDAGDRRGGATRRIVCANPEVRVLILTTFDLDEYAFGALAAGPAVSF